MPPYVDPSASASKSTERTAAGALDAAADEAGALDIIGSLDAATILDGAALDGATLEGATLDGATLDGAVLDGATLDSATLEGATLAGALDELIMAEDVFGFLSSSSSPPRPTSSADKKSTEEIDLIISNSLQKAMRIIMARLLLVLVEHGFGV
jgi:hypothetical protein